MPLEYAFLLLLIIGVIAYLILKNINDLERAVENRDPDSIVRILSGTIGRILVVLKWELVSNALDILFFSARFQNFTQVVNNLKIEDNRSLITSREPLIISLDIETEIDLETKPREIGLSVFRITDWSEVFRVKISSIINFEEKFGVEARYFLGSLLRRFDHIVGHNIYDFDAKILSKWGIDLSEKLILDTLALSFLVLPEAASHSLEFLCEQFEIYYRAHEPDEDAYASMRLLQYLVSIASIKGLELKALAKLFKPIEGLEDLVIPSVKVKYPPERRRVEDNCLLIAPDANRYEVSWYPEVVYVPDLGVEEIKDSFRVLSIATINSYVAGGGRDPSKLEELVSLLIKKGSPYKEYSRALLSELEMRVREEPVPETGFAIEHKYFLQLVSKLERRFRRIVVRGWLVFKGYGIDPVNALETALKISDDVMVESPFPPPLEGLKFHHPIEDQPSILFIRKGLDVGIRHINFFGKLLSSLLISRGRKVVIAANMREKIAVDKVSSFRKVIAVTSMPVKVSQVIRNSYELAHMGYDVVIFSLANLSRNLRSSQMDLLKELFEVSWLAGRELIVLNAWSEVLDDEQISKAAKHLELEPDEEFSLRMPYTVFNSIDNVVAEVNKIVERIWGFQTRPYQRRCISRLLSPYCSGHLMTKPLSVIILPTGSGKSLIFQSVARFLREKIGGSTVVISPLLALMRDQIVTLRKRGLSVCEISSASADSIGKCLRGLEKGWFDLVYITPEQLRKDNIRRALERAEINYFIIDEVHTMHKWKGFRPSYSFLADYLKKRREEGFWFPLAGFTATITGEGLQDVMNMLVGYPDFDLEEIDFKTDYKREKVDYEEIKVIKGPLMRENLILDVREDGSGIGRLEALVDMVKELTSWAEGISDDKPWLGLIFASFVRSNKWYENVPQLAKYLEMKINEPVLYFHGQMNTGDKKKVLNLIEEVSEGIRKQPRIIVATKAFGMGVDIPNIRWIIHYMMPESVEDYYQEIGRGGRDGLDTKTVLLYSGKYDFNRRMRLLKMGFIRPELVLRIFERLKKADEGSVVPLMLLLPKDLLARGYRKALNAFSNNTFPEELERLVERSIAVLSAVGALDYELTYREVAVVRANNDLHPAYWIGRGYALVSGEITSPERLDLTFGQDGDFLIVKGRGMFSGRKVRCIQVNYLSREVDPDLVSRVVIEEQQRQILSLSFMEQLCNTVSRAPESRKNLLARYMIVRYLSGSLKELYKAMLLGRERELARIFRRDILSLYNKMLQNKAFKVKVSKENIARTFATLVVLRMIKAGKLPSEIVVVVPYGYKSLLENSINEIVEELKLPSMIPQVKVITRKMIYSQEKLREIMASGDEILVLANSSVLNRFMKKCASTGKEVHVLKLI